MVLGIDMDDTICSTNEFIIEEAHLYDIEKLGGTGVKDVNAYNFCDMMGWPEGLKGQFFADKLETIMSSAPIKHGAKEVINKLHDEGWKIVIISFRKDKYLTDPYGMTKKWLKDNGVKYDKLYVNTGTKTDECIENDVTLFIDDKESHCEDVNSAGIDVLLFTNAYNHEESRFDRVDNWLEVYDYIKEKYNGGKSSN